MAKKRLQKRGVLYTEVQKVVFKYTKTRSNTSRTLKHINEMHLNQSKKKKVLHLVTDKIRH